MLSYLFKSWPAWRGSAVSCVSGSCLTKRKLLSFGILCAWKLSVLLAICCLKLTLRATPPLVAGLYFSVHDAAKLFPDSLASLLQTNKQWKIWTKKAVMGNLRACLLICSLRHRVLMGVTWEKCWCAIWTVPTEWVTRLSCYPAHLLALHSHNRAAQFCIQDRLSFLCFIEMLMPDKKIVCICNMTAGDSMAINSTNN